VQRQLVLGERDHGWSEADRAVDRAVLKFGAAAVRPATLIAGDRGRTPRGEQR
jgi:DNA polymerase-4